MTTAPTSEFAPLIPSRLRRPAAVLAATCSFVLVSLAIGFAGTAYAGPLDVAIGSVVEEWTASHPAATWLMVQFGDPVAAAIMTALLAMLCYLTGRTPFAALTLGSMAVAGTAVLTLKPLVGRTLDCTQSFPSGHTAAVTIVAVVVGMLALSRPKRYVVRAAVGAAVASAGVASLMGAALVARGSHYVTDVVGGFCLAVATVLLVAFVLDLLGSTFTSELGARSE